MGTSHAADDWEVFGRMKVDAGNVPSTQFLSVLEWVPSTSMKSMTSAVSSSSGQVFDGALVGSSLVMFMRSWPAAFTGVTYPASGATKQYVADLKPNTSYTLTGAGAPAKATTDAGGVLAFTAAGSGDITVSP
jgi:hypothetical protein